MREDALTYPFWIDETATPRRWRIGLTESFLETLDGETMVSVELLRVGTRLTSGDALGLLFLSRRTVDLRAPFAGEIVALNEALALDPRIIQVAPYTRGWLMEITHFEIGEIIDGAQ